MSREYFIKREFGFYDSGLLVALSPAVVHVYEVLRRFVWRGRETRNVELRELQSAGKLAARVSQTLLGEYTDLRRETVSRAMQTLYQLNWVQRGSENRDGGSCVYVLGEVVRDGTGLRHEVFYSDAWLSCVLDEIDEQARVQTRNESATMMDLPFPERLALTKQAVAASLGTLAPQLPDVTPAPQNGPPSEPEAPPPAPSPAAPREGGYSGSPFRSSARLASRPTSGTLGEGRPSQGLSRGPVKKRTALWAVSDDEAGGSAGAEALATVKQFYGVRKDKIRKPESTEQNVGCDFQIDEGVISTSLGMCAGDHTLRREPEKEEKTEGRVLADANNTSEPSGETDAVADTNQTVEAASDDTCSVVQDELEELRRTVAEVQDRTRGVHQQRVSKLLGDARSKDQKAENLKGKPVKISERKQLTACERIWLDGMMVSFPGVAFAVWGGEERGKCRHLLEKYPGVVVEHALQYMISEWSQINERILKGKGSVPSLGLLVKAHDILIPESQQWAARRAVEQEYQQWFKDNPKNPYPPEELERRYRALRAQPAVAGSKQR